MNMLKSIRKWWRSLTRKERRLVTAAACLAAGIATVALIAIIVGNDDPPPPGKPPPAAAAVLLDVSDPVTGGNAEEVINEIAKIGGGLPPYGELTVYDMHDRSKVVVSLRRPRRESDCFALVERCGHLDAIYMKEFEEELRARLMRFLSAQECKDTSPIIEGLWRLSRLSGYKRMPDGSKSLYVVSDMLQHSSACGSHYNQPVGPSGFAELQNTPCYRKYKADFDGWDVTALYILRHDNSERQDDDHKRFWIDHFEASNARSVKITEVNYFGSGAQCQARP